MFERFTSLVAVAPQAAALIAAGSGEITTRESLAAQANDVAGRLAAAGMVQGDALAIQLPNSAELVAAVLAAAKLGLVAVPIDRDAPAGEVGAILNQFAIKGLAGRSGVFVRAGVARPQLPPQARLIKLTSGSTGKPKGIVTSEANLIADCTNVCATMAIRPEDVNLGAIPFSHSYGFSNLVTPLILQGTAIVVSNDYLPQSILDLANRHRCTVAPLIPMVFAHLISTAHGRFETVRTFISAGAPLPPSTSRRFRERFGIDVHSFYGCSECGGITYDRPGAAVERETVGAALEGVELKIDRSRVTVRSGSVALGYLLDATTFEPFANGAFRTDDLVELRNGEVALTGRASDLINTAGKKVNPREIEAVLLEIEGVREAKVYGEPAGARGEVVAAAIVATPDVTREQVRAFCRGRLSAHKVPRIVKLIDQMPLDERGKIKRAALAAL
jgi:acyl-CoA synthetase (AMP-forming)/AMP-acid ligase II